MSDLDRIEKRITDLQQELADLETARRVIIGLSNGELQSGKQPVGTKQSKHVHLT